MKSESRSHLHLATAYAFSFTKAGKAESRQACTDELHSTCDRRSSNFRLLATKGLQPGLEGVHALLEIGHAVAIT